MWKTVLFLIFGLIAIPLIAYNFDTKPTDAQQHVMNVLIATYLVAASLTFIVSEISKNYSQVDKLWSIIPIVYAWEAAYVTEWNSRVVLMALLVTVWGVRLTYNFNRRGGYSWRFWEGDEDYRWEILRAKPEFKGAWKWRVFNLFFVSFYQMGLIMLFTFPLVKVADSAVPVGIWDYFLAAVILVLVYLEWKADEEQWVFQNKKHEYLKRGEEPPAPYNVGFTHTGLWGIVRHPNYACEQAIWIVFYFFSVVATGMWVNWSIAGAILLVLLFKGSSNFSESVSAEKYPAYKEYQKKVGRFIPKSLKKAVLKEEVSA